MRQRYVPPTDFQLRRQQEPYPPQMAISFRDGHLRRWQCRVASAEVHHQDLLGAHEYPDVPAVLATGQLPSQ
eukprot:5509239-Pleurochrysis_carterae.AAC.1